jgi:hypothetical protein
MAQETTENPKRMITIPLPTHPVSPKRPKTPAPNPGTALIASIVTSGKKIYNLNCEINELRHFAFCSFHD